MRKFATFIFDNRVKILLNLGVGSLCLLGFLVSSHPARAFVNNTVNPDDISNDKPDVFLGSDGFARIIYYNTAGELAYVKCSSDICTTNTKTVLNIGSGVVNNGNVVAYKKSTTGDIRIFFIATNAGVHTLRRIDCDTGDNCTAASIVYTFGNYIFGTQALSVDKDSTDQARFYIVFTDMSGSITQRAGFYYCTGECVLGTVTQFLIYGIPSASASFYSPKIVIASGNFPYIAFQQLTTPTSGQMRFVRCTTVTCSSRVNTTIETYTATTSLVLGTTDMVIKTSDSFPFIVYSRSIDGVLKGKMVSCFDQDCGVSRISTDINNGNQIRAIINGAGKLRVQYVLTTGSALLYEKWCSTGLDCVSGFDVQPEPATNVAWPTPFLNPSNNVQSVYNADPGGGLDLRLVCGIEGPACPSPNLVIRDKNGNVSSPAVTYTTPITVGVPTDFYFSVANIGLATSAVTTANVTATGSTNSSQDFSVSNIVASTNSPWIKFTTQWNSMAGNPYTLTFTADSQNDDTESNEADNSVSISINITLAGVPTYTVSVAPVITPPVNLTVNQGGFVDYNVTVNVTSLPTSAQIVLTANNLTSNGITQTFTPSSLTFSSAGIQTSGLRVDVSALTAPTLYTLQVTGTVFGTAVTSSGNALLGVVAYKAPWIKTTKGDVGSIGNISLSSPVIPRTVIINSELNDGFLEDNGSSGSPICTLPCDRISVGSWWYGRGTHDGFFRFNTSTLTGKTILSAKLTLKPANSYVSAVQADGEFKLHDSDWTSPFGITSPLGAVDSSPQSTLTYLEFASFMVPPAEKVFNNLNLNYLQTTAASRGFTGYRLHNYKDQYFGGAGAIWVDFQDAESGAGPALEVTYLDPIANTDYLGISNLNAGLTSAKNWLIPNYSPPGGLSSGFAVGQDVYDYLYSKFGAQASVINPTNADPTKNFCTPPSTFGFTSYGLNNTYSGNTGGNAGDAASHSGCVVTDLTPTGTHQNRFASSGCADTCIDNGFFIYKGDATYSGDLTWSVQNNTGSNYTIATGHPTIIFVTGNLYINKSILTAGSKKFIFIVKNDSNNANGVDTDDAIQVNPALDQGEIDAFLVTSGKFNSAKWLNSRNQTRYDNAIALEKKIREYKVATGNYPQPPLSGCQYAGCAGSGVQNFGRMTSDGCSNIDATFPAHWFDITNPPGGGVGLNPVGGTNWDGKTGAVNNINNPCTATEGLRYQLGAGLGAGWPAAIPGYTGIDINTLKDPTNGGVITNKPSGTGVVKPKRFALQIRLWGTVRTAPLAYGLFWSIEDDGGADHTSIASDPEYHICGGDYNNPDSFNPLKSQDGSFCYLQKLVIKGGIYANGMTLGRDLRDDNNSSYQNVANCNGGAPTLADHCPTPAESANYDPSILYYFAQPNFLTGTSIIKEDRP